MPLSATVATRNNALGALKTQLDGGLLYIFSGAIPANADVALDMVSTHTLLCVIGNGGSATGVTFESPGGGVLAKDSGENWTGTSDFNGAHDGDSAIAPTFFRICAAGDNGQAAADGSTGFRIQGSVGGPSSGADLQIGTATMTNGNAQPIGSASFTLA